MKISLKVLKYILDNKGIRYAIMLNTLKDVKLEYIICTVNMLAMSDIVIIMNGIIFLENESMLREIIKRLEIEREDGNKDE